jgi:hypothetical protein
MSFIGTKSGSSLLPESLRDAQSTRNNVNHMRNQADPPAASAGHRVSLNRDALMYIVVANVLGRAAQSGRLGRGLTHASVTAETAYHVDTVPVARIRGERTSRAGTEVRAEK